MEEAGAGRGCYTCCRERCGAELGQRQAGGPGDPQAVLLTRGHSVCPGTFDIPPPPRPPFVTAWGGALPASRGGDLPSISVCSSLMKIIGKSKWANTCSLF